MNLTTSHNDTWWEPSPSFSQIYDVIGGLCVVNTACIVLVNTLLIFIVTSSRKLRTSFLNQLVLSVAVSDWLYGAVWCPMKADHTFTRRWRFGCWVHVAYQLYEGYIQMYITTWFIVIFNAHYIIKRAKMRSLRVSKHKLFALRLGILAAPWVLAAVTILPLAMSNLHPVWNESVWTKSYCAVILTRWAEILLSCLCFFLPASVLLIQALYICLTLGSQDRRSLRMTSWNRTLHRKISYCVIAASVVTVGLNFGDQVCDVMKDIYDWHSRQHVITWYAMDTLADFQKVVLPLVWLLLPDIREELGLKIKWWIGGSYLSEDTVEVRYYRNYAQN